MQYETETCHQTSCLVFQRHAVMMDIISLLHLSAHLHKKVRGQGQWEKSLHGFSVLQSKFSPDSPRDEMRTVAKREAKQRDWWVIWSTQRRVKRCKVRHVCMCACSGKSKEAVVLNWDKLELLEGLLLPGWPLKEQLVLALIHWIDVAGTPGYLSWSHRSIWQGNLQQLY